jgi:GTPase SAR1 family protein
VVGEAKRGKSCFINALIGRAILPTDVDIATSQVFLISKADQEAYRLRFEDDSTQDIAATDLPRFGSQVLADVAGTPRLDQLIRWIEVDAPARFLPDGVSLLDTPGLGSLYAAHSQITQRFIPQADAVIYVLDSGQPIGQADLEALAAILEATHSLFFIQTRIDQFRKEHWQALQLRNEQVLHERFAETLADTRVWPISSTNLMTAGVTAGAAGSAADLLTDLKSGYLLGANPRKQFIAQAWGIVAGTLSLQDLCSAFADYQTSNSLVFAAR